MKLTDTQLEVLRFIPSSNTNAGATPLEMQKAGIVGYMTTSYIFEQFKREGLVTVVGPRMVRRTKKGDEVVSPLTLAPPHLFLLRLLPSASELGFTTFQLMNKAPFGYARIKNELMDHGLMEAVFDDHIRGNRYRRTQKGDEVVK